MTLPMVCYITWNRAGLTAISLKALLDTEDDFELYIIDNNSEDDTWEIVNSIKDDRIKLKKRFDLNRGEIYAVNYVLSLRKKDQYFILIENDILIKTKDWVTQFMLAMEAFPELGLLGTTNEKLLARDFKELPSLINKGDIGYYDAYQVRGSCNCLRPELLEYLGYYNEETGWGDRDNCYRINNFTPYKTGYSSNIIIELMGTIPCNQCSLKEKCSLVKKTTCFEIYTIKDNYPQSTNAARHKHATYIHETTSGKRSIFCASIHDEESMKNHVYYKDWAKENFQFYIDNAN